jgi:arylsulfatase A-like enzyme
MRTLFIDIDTLRPDHLGCYGYHRDTSPHIDRLAAEGLRLDQCYTSDAPCLPSRAALMTGRFGVRTGVVNHGGTNADMRLQGAPRGFRDDSFENLPWIMRGLSGQEHTASISTFPERHAAWWFNSGFKETHNVGGGGHESGEAVTPVAQRWLRANARNDNWYLHVHYWDPHTVYRAPASFGEPFADAPPPAWITAEVLARHQAQCGPHTPYEINMYDGKPLPRYPRHVPAIRDLADLKKHFDGYDTGIRYADAQVGLLLAELAAAGVLEDTMIIISSDHGENQGELGIYAEHGTADAATCRVPMIIRMPGGARGVVDRELRYQFDLLPTLMQINDREPPSGWDGRGFGDLLRGRGASPGHETLVTSQCAHGAQRGVRWDRWLYLRTWHVGYHLFPREMLFDLVADPHEQHDLAPTRPDLCAEGCRRYLAWHDAVMARLPEGYCEDPLQRVLAEGPGHCRGMIAKTGYDEHLRATGRAWAVDELRKRHPKEF